jgi:hypothetical protein
MLSGGGHTIKVIPGNATDLASGVINAWVCQIKLRQVYLPIFGKVSKNKPDV